jgi:tetratricopeptide (TPR) repeat protein
VDDAIQTVDEEFLHAIDHIGAGEYALAFPILARLVAFQPRDQRIFEAWIEAHIGLERYAKAVEIADAGLAEGRPAGALQFFKALVYATQDDLERAEAAARAAIAAEPPYGAAVVLLSSILAKQDRFAEALDLCQRAAVRNPDDEELAFHVVSLAQEMGLHQLVVDSARAYLKRFGRQADVLSLLGSAYADLKEYRKADRAFRDAAALEPDEADHHFNIVMLAIQAGNEAVADSYLDKLALRDELLADSVAAEVDHFFEQLEAEEAGDEKP